MEFDILIPARYSATRLPGKPLLDVCGKPLIQWVYERAKSSKAQHVVVATDDERIEQAVKKFGGEVCMTRTDHQSGSDRIAEVVNQLHLPKDRIIVNLQGDEPSIPQALINKVARRLFTDDQVAVATACHEINTDKEFKDPNIVKVVCNTKGHALYFSRAPIPWPRDGKGNSVKALRHIGIYAYRAEFLREFTRWPETDAEKTEQLEQLRILEHGVPIAVCRVEELPEAGIDTQADLERFKQSVQSCG
ncbi:MAG: 3-deoxy-manno-octulosonate cytidylyltransferase [Arenicellales bacterium]|nr:3-deoxy-manno-octulosonate cytidylyltransferase [Arenicellales bacterium]